MTSRGEKVTFDAVTARYLSALAVASMLSGCAHVSESACVASPQAKSEIEATVKALFDALREENKGAFQRLTTTSFYAFDGGNRYAGTELVDLVRDAHARGVQLNWSLGAFDTKVGCGVGWSAWENVGSAGKPSELKPVRWLESAVLVRQGGSWKVDFFHSQRAAAK